MSLLLKEMLAFFWKKTVHAPSLQLAEATGLWASAREMGASEIIH